MNPREHVAAAQDFLDLADSPIAQQNRLLRSELLWCAAAHAVKSIARQYGWDNNSHDDLFRVVRRLARNLSDSRLIESFGWANRLHRNMYKGDMDDQAIARGRHQVRRLVRRLAELVV